MRLHRALTALAALALLGACEENAVQDITGPAAGARIRFFNFGINAPQVQLYAGDQKVTATSSTSCQSAKNPPVTANDSLCATTGIESVAGIAYGSSAAGGNYTGIQPGQYTFEARLMSAADRGTPIASVPATIADGKAYSYFVSGFYNAATKQADAFIVEDNMPAAIDWSAAYVRLVNASPNAQPMSMTLTDIASGQTITVGSAVAYKSASEFVKVPVAGYNLALRVGNQLAVTGTNFGFEPGVVYSITLRGDMTVTSTTAANRPILESWIHR